MIEVKDKIVKNTDHPDMRLRMIDIGDIEDLREWKNANKNSFFLRQDITPEQQGSWYASFRERADDFMFVVEQLSGVTWNKIGCMGFRYLADERCVDGYNIIRARKVGDASFSMSDAFRTMLAFADSEYPDQPIRVKVLIGNPAVAWYERNGFKTVEEEDGYFLMEVDKQTLEDLNLEVE
jgi:hypothetical protein